MDGLGGSFTYCTLGDPVELDKILLGETLPTDAGIGSVLFHMATNHPFDPAAAREAEFYLGATDVQHVWLIYRPDLEWLKSPDAALIHAYINAHNAEPKPFRWTKSADDILAAINRFCLRTLQIQECSSPRTSVSGH